MSIFALMGDNVCEGQKYKKITAPYHGCSQAVKGGTSQLIWCVHHYSELQNQKICKIPQSLKMHLLVL